MLPVHSPIILPITRLCLGESSITTSVKYESEAFEHREPLVPPTTRHLRSSGAEFWHENPGLGKIGKVFLRSHLELLKISHRPLLSFTEIKEEGYVLLPVWGNSDKPSSRSSAGIAKRYTLLPIPRSVCSTFGIGFLRRSKKSLSTTSIYRLGFSEKPIERTAVSI